MRACATACAPAGEGRAGGQASRRQGGQVRACDWARVALVPKHGTHCTSPLPLFPLSGTRRIPRPPVAGRSERNATSGFVRRITSLLGSEILGVRDSRLDHRGISNVRPQRMRGKKTTSANIGGNSHNLGGHLYAVAHYSQIAKCHNCAKNPAKTTHSGLKLH